MNDAPLYNKTNVLPRRDAALCLEEYGKSIKWKESGGRILDIGCGDGSVTVDIIRKHVPSNFKIVASDINEDMVKFAQDNHARSDVEFAVLNIEEDLPKGFRNSFDHAVSFYVLHWIQDQDKGFSNIYNLLSENGSCFLVFLGHMPLFDAWRQLSRMDRWRHWVKDVERYTGPYHDSQEPEKEVEQRMKKIGFTNVEVIKKSWVYNYNNAEFFKQVLAAVNPFRVPTEHLDAYLDDTADAMRRLNEANVNNGGLIDDTFHYTLLIAIGNK